VVKTRPGVLVKRRLRNTNDACDRTRDRTSCAAKAGGHALTAVTKPAKPAPIGMISLPCSVCWMP
jgi:hypothetical protein